MYIKPTSFKAIFIFAALFFAITSKINAQTPFTCNANLYLSNSLVNTDATQLNKIITNTNPNSTIMIGDTSHGLQYNGIGYNTKDNFIYGVTPKSNRLIRIDAAGVATDLGAVTSLPIISGGASNSYVSGGMDTSGFLYEVYNNTFIKIDVNAVAVVATYSFVDPMNNPLAGILNFGDISYYPANGKFYGINPLSNIFYSFEIVGANVVVTPIGSTGVAPGTNYGAGWMFNSGQYYALANVLGKFYQVDISTGFALEIGTGIAGNNQLDGANCQLSTLLLDADLAVTKTDSTPSYIPGTTTTYTIVATNNGINGVMGATVVDSLPAGIPSANMSYTAVASPGSRTAVVGTKVGTINDTVDLIVGGKVTYTVTVTIPSAFLGNLINTVVISPPINVIETDTTNNIASDTNTAIKPDTVTVRLTCDTCSTAPICATADDLPTGAGTTTYTSCGLMPAGMGTQVLNTTTGCIVFTGNGTQTGADTVRTCVVACKGGICDTTYINILPPIMPDTVTVRATCDTCTTAPICATADDLPGGASATTYSTCGLMPAGMGTQTLNTTTGCITFTGNGTQTGLDTIKTCVVACKDGMCDTTYINILPPINPDTITVRVTCDTCTTAPICATADDLPGGASVITYNSCGLTPAGMGTQTLNTTTGCITFTGNGTQAATDTVKTCVVACKDGVCDTTYVNILPPIRPDTVIVTPSCDTCATGPICATADDLLPSANTGTYANCGLSASESTQGTLTSDSNSCLIWTPNGNQTDTIKTCVVKCLDGLCDTTYILIPPPNISLPVNYTHFSVRETNCKIDLNWRTSQEVNTSYFNVMRKTSEETNFKVIAKIDAAGNSNTPIGYHYIDQGDKYGSYEYQINTIDIDSKSSLSETRFVKFDCQDHSIAIYPNPTFNVLNISGLEGTESIQLYSITGQLLSTILANSSLMTIDFSTYANGSYLVYIIDENGNRIITKVFKN